jgi:mRNA-degrading endonuclease toxin of MazEF toxin-antitoxin module
VTRTKRGYPTHVEIDPTQSPESRLDTISYAQTENIRVMPFKRLVRPLGRLPAGDMSRVEETLRRVLVL